MLRMIHLHGGLKTFSNKPLKVDANTMVEVTRGLIHQLGSKFKFALREGQYHIFRGKRKNKVDIGEDEVEFELGKTEEIHIYPVVNAKSAAARIVAGVALIAIGFFIPATSTLMTKLGSGLIAAGIGMALGGVASMLAPKPSVSSVSQAGSQASFMFNGTVNVTEQGTAIPIVFGEVTRAGGVVLSAGLTTENLSI